VYPITNPESDELLQLHPLPDNADRVAVRQAVDAAIREYVGGAERDQRIRDVLLRIKRHIDSRVFQKLCQDILELKNLSPDSQAEAALRQLLTQVRSRAGARAANYHPTARRERFMTTVALAWAGPGKGTLSIYADGSFVGFLAAIYERVEGRTLDGAGVKRFAKRRRDFLNSISEVLSASSNMRIDESGVYVLDADGQWKPD
jgi:hypothetical protein